MMRHVSVVIPALNEQDTVAGVVAAALADHPGEVLVIDSDSQDATASRAERAGARVVHWTRDVLPQVAPWSGKGEALWRGVAAASGEVVVFMDADLKDPRPGMVAALAAPFADPRVAMVRARYQRRLNGVVGEGGRVTELTARPLLSALFPELAHIGQPLGGEYALCTRVARELPFIAGYGVEAGLLIDVARAYSPAAIAEVDLGVRAHRNRPLAQLRGTADDVARALLQRAGVAGVQVRERPPLSRMINCD
ncbi:glucosyl-3-phosphoglycerate synthase [Corynebacterium uberis]|uniref:glucosyl-3-phosphoglycerate synthase n=1 Tax=Corynebacterium TaxID=1716 RepID=UPI001D0AF8FB|nr:MULTISPECIES: glucosyl-3-phosphoglycerate synthase [Corynebacterium]MCZ9308959.1 glucosyl-3-phosphoglycerate synthase [Corynebacterium sp. c6VSa_13]UDL74570.1 glucosyl-3-phosphoglycerate synthase [Corynebacterium uberis]UDL76596.1 glucosyl-3-phosphoglycerate synthase [Corynebacterium uberis]UDL78809.1 glucosyl-3-phosphoglycerate synthase [Corynebacterium uberis]UDL81087.1 glucosyl-3-phosphoglycerate synthase [Corynebacterium uberis]